MGVLELVILLSVINSIEGLEKDDSLTVVCTLHDMKNESAVDMEELGIFDTGCPFDYPPMERSISLKPDSRENITTEFSLFSSTNKDIPDKINNTHFFCWSEQHKGFPRAVETYFILRDYLGRNSKWQIRMKDAILRTRDCNVFIVDWSDDDQRYEQAVANIRVVGAEIGLLIERLVYTSKLDPGQVHIIGHGLGAHAAGYAGKWFQNKQNKSIGRITGLDPSGPFFNGVHKVVRLDKGDAKFVDVIHTNMDGKRSTGYGLQTPIGHADYYPNGGEYQPGCESSLDVASGKRNEFASYTSGFNVLHKFYHGDIIKVTEEEHRNLVCSHNRAYEYFIESLEDGGCKFDSMSCYNWHAYNFSGCGPCNLTTCMSMGFYSDIDNTYSLKFEGPLKLYLKTNDSPPYCIGNPQRQLSKLYSDTKRFLKQIYQRCNLVKIGIKDLLCL